jgi:F-type H+-transporting ATPase subunit a
LKNLFFLVLFLSFSVSFSSSESDSSSKDFNVTDMIMHHIKDSHEFHILDWNGKGISIPLPVILWTDNGLVTFSSSEFHHDDEGTEVVTKKSYVVC